MKGLILKDMYLLRKEFKNYALLAVFALLFPVFTKSSSDSIAYNPISTFNSLSPVMVILAINLTLNSFVYDERCGYMQYVFATPVRRSSYVAAKYLSHIMYAGIGSLIGTLCNFMTLIVSGAMRWEYVFQQLIFCLVLFIATLLLGCWEIGLSMKFESTKARMVMLAVIIIAGVLCGVSIFLALHYKEEVQWFLLLPPAAGLLLGSSAWMVWKSFVWARKKEF